MKLKKPSPLPKKNFAGKLKPIMTYHTPSIINIHKSSTERPEIYFDRRELNQIIGIYGQMVAAGLWKDYLIEQSKHTIAFAVFQRSAETPLYRIIKDPRLAKKQGAFSIVNRSGHTIKRGKDLSYLLNHFKRILFKIVEA